MQTLKMKNEKLEKLCRALQSERNQLGKELKKVLMCLLSSPLVTVTVYDGHTVYDGQELTRADACFTAEEPCTRHSVR